MAELVDAFRADLFKLNRPKESCSENPRKWWKFAVQSVLQELRAKRNRFSWAAATICHLDSIEEIYHEANVEMMRATPLGLRLITMEALREEVDFLKRDNELLHTMLSESIRVEPETNEMGVQCVALELDAEMQENLLSKSPSKVLALADHISDLTAMDSAEDDTVKLFAFDEILNVANDPPVENSSVVTVQINNDNNKKSGNIKAEQPSQQSSGPVSPRLSSRWIDPGPKHKLSPKNKPRVYQLAEAINVNSKPSMSHPPAVKTFPSSSSVKVQPEEDLINITDSSIEVPQLQPAVITNGSQPTSPQQSRRSHRPSWRVKHEQVLIDIYSTPVYRQTKERSRSRSPRSAAIHNSQQERFPSPTRKKAPPKELVAREEMTYSRQVAIDILNKVRTHNGKRPHGAQARKVLSLAERTLLRSPFAHVVMRDPPIDKPKTTKLLLPTTHNEEENVIDAVLDVEPLVKQKWTSQQFYPTSKN